MMDQSANHTLGDPTEYKVSFCTGEWKTAILEGNTEAEKSGFGKVTSIAIQ